MLKEGIRSFLFVPADKMKMLQKSLALSCDAFIFDLEDSVAPVQKSEARENLNAFFAGTDNRQCRFVRINAADTTFFEEDVALMLRLRPDGIVLPKADVVSVQMLAERLDSQEDCAQIQIAPICETAAAMECLGDILRSSARIHYGFLGGEDLTRDVGMKRTREGEELTFARWRFLFACAANNIIAVDTVFPNVQDMEGLGNEVNRVRDMGYTSKACIHPSHIEVINRLLSPSEEDIARARRIVEASKSPAFAGKGSFALDNSMIDLPVIRRAEKLLARANIQF